jgi:hypothetical protein
MESRWVRKSDVPDAGGWHWEPEAPFQNPEATTLRMACGMMVDRERLAERFAGELPSVDLRCRDCSTAYMAGQTRG